MTAFLYLVYLVLLFAATFIGGLRFRMADKAGRVIIIYTGITFVFEASATFSAYVFKNNIAIYALYSILELTCIMLYFTYCLQSLRRWRFLALLPLFAGPFLSSPARASLAVLVCLQLTAALLVSLLCLWYFLQQLNKSCLKVRMDVHFWFCSLMLIYRCASLFYWLYSSDPRNEACFGSATLLLIFVNLCCTLLVTAIYYYYPKLQSSRSCPHTIMH